MPAFTQQKWHHQLVENFNIYLHAKNKVRHVLLPWDIETLEFYWLTAFGPITGDPEFCQIPDWCWNINNNISFHFRLFSRKTNMTKFFKRSKKPYFGANLGKNEFSWNKVLCQLLNIPIINHCVKNKKKIMSHSWEKFRTVGWTDRQQWFYKTLRRTRVQLLKKLQAFSEFILTHLNHFIPLFFPKISQF